MPEPPSETSSQRPPFAVSARIRSFVHAGRGLRLLLLHEHNAWLHGGATVVVLSAAVLFDITRLGWAAVLIAIALVWIAEAFNTAVERLADAVTRENHPLIRDTKDLAAAGVLVAAMAAVCIGIIVFSPYLFAIGFRLLSE